MKCIDAYIGKDRPHQDAMKIWLDKKRKAGIEPEPDSMLNVPQRCPRCEDPRPIKKLKRKVPRPPV